MTGRMVNRLPFGVVTTVARNEQKACPDEVPVPIAIRLPAAGIFSPQLAAGRDDE